MQTIVLKPTANKLNGATDNLKRYRASEMVYITIRIAAADRKSEKAKIEPPDADA